MASVSGENRGSGGEDTPTARSLPAELGGIGIEFEFQRMFQTAADRANRIARGFSTLSSSSQDKGSGTNPEDKSKTSLPAMKRFYTCPLDQVVQEMDQKVTDKSVSLAFARLFTDHEGQELVFAESLYDVLHLFCKSVARVSRDIEDTSQKSDEKIIDERALFEVWNTCAFTVHSAVHSEMDAGKASLLVPSGMSMRNHECLAALVRFCAVLSSHFGEPKIIRSHGLRLLSLLTEMDGLENPCILDLDAFGLLVSLTFCIPSLFNGDHAAHLPLGNVQDQHLLRLIYLVHLVQIMITKDQFSSSKLSSKSFFTNESLRLKVSIIIRKRCNNLICSLRERNFRKNWIFTVF